jgi:hypothetical protein
MTSSPHDGTRRQGRKHVPLQTCHSAHTLKLDAGRPGCYRSYASMPSCALHVGCNRWQATTTPRRPTTLLHGLLLGLRSPSSLD